MSGLLVGRQLQTDGSVMHMVQHSSLMTCPGFPYNIFICSPPMMQRQSHCLAHTGLRFDRWQSRNFNRKLFLSGNRRDGVAKLQLLVSVPMYT